MPPNHCNKALQSKIPLGSSSRLFKIVEPVVVIPLMDSKRASVMLRFSFVYIKGMAQRIAKSIQDKTVMMNASFIEIFNSTFC